MRTLGVLINQLGLELQPMLSARNIVFVDRFPVRFNWGINNNRDSRGQCCWMDCANGHEGY